MPSTHALPMPYSCPTPATTHATHGRLLTAWPLRGRCLLAQLGDAERRVLHLARRSLSYKAPGIGLGLGIEVKVRVAPG